MDEVGSCRAHAGLCPLFAYHDEVSLRRELNVRAAQLDAAYEVTYGRDDLYSPSVVFVPGEENHPNFHPASYRRILAKPEWAARLAKAYSENAKRA